jgi:hypothetical protein
MSVITQRGMSHGDLYSFLQALANRVFATAGLAAGTTNTRVKTVNAVDYMIRGKVYSKAGTDPVDDFDAGFTNTVASQFCKVRLEIDTAGVVTGKQGPIRSAQALAEIPKRSANKATLGWIEIPASFTFGTTSYGGATFNDGDPDLGDGIGLPPGDRGVSQEVYTGP